MIDNKLVAKEAQDDEEQQFFIKDQFSTLDSDTDKYMIRLTFHGQYNENYIIIEVPRHLLAHRHPLSATLFCNPYGISNDSRKIKFGLWQSATVNSQEQINGKHLKLKFKQGPYKSKKSLI